MARICYNLGSIGVSLTYNFYENISQLALGICIMTHCFQDWYLIVVKGTSLKLSFMIFNDLKIVGIHVAFSCLLWITHFTLSYPTSTSLIFPTLKLSTSESPYSILPLFYPHLPQKDSPLFPF